MNNKYNETIKMLTPLQYKVTQEKGTELPFDNEYNNEYRDGIYVDIVSKEILFSSKDKFNSGSGWPSFTNPVKKTSIDEVKDHAHGMIRIEVKSKNANTHLGHVFNDGPNGNMRYCINSASIFFILKEEMKDKGYEDYLNLFDK
jgi:methionine-R-sulfoxide reductase